ncbi:MAG TPA: hypothetical protein VN767_16695 [Streptosporangiaceae bacterium]|jgi:hypothetical protein|nr:hypothetical protein [Streptosporangiaceae bacterium]
MQTSVTDPPFVPIRRSGWPVRRTPRWAIAAGVVLLAGGVAVGLSHHPSQGERASDLTSLLTTLNTDVESCSGGVGDALAVLTAIQTGASQDVPTAISLANLGASNCSPANNEQLDDLTGVQVPESLASFHLQAAVKDVIDWAAPDAGQVQADVAKVLGQRGKPGEQAAKAALARDLSKLKRQREVVYAALRPAISALSPRSKPPVLWVTARPSNSY